MSNYLKATLLLVVLSSSTMLAQKDSIMAIQLEYMNDLLIDDTLKSSDHFDEKIQYMKSLYTVAIINESYTSYTSERAGIGEYYLLDIKNKNMYHCNQSPRTTSRPDAFRYDFSKKESIKGRSIHFFDDSIKWINNLPCRLIEIKSKDTSNYVLERLYVTDALAGNFSRYYPFAFKGVVVHSERRYKNEPCKTISKLHSFKPVKVPKDFFSISDYRVLDGDKRNLRSLKKWLKERKKRKAKQEKLVQAKTAPTFKVDLLRGEEFKLVPKKLDHILVINIWGLFCGPCKKEIPKLNQLVEKYQQYPDVQFLAITADNKERLSKYINKQPFTYQQGYDGFEAIEKFVPEAYPTHIVINKKGEIVDYFVGAKNINEKISKTLDRLLDTEQKEKTRK